VQRRCVNAIANAVESTTPIATSPAVRLASAVPTPPGEGMRLENADAAVLTRTSCAKVRWTPKARQAAPSVRA
jgi:hypothetical protein